MIERLPRFNVEFGYVHPLESGDVRFGKLEKKTFTFRELEFILRIMSPVHSSEWLSYIRNLRKNSDYRIGFDENTENGIIKKVIRISR